MSFWILLAWVFLRFPRSIINKFRHWHWRDVTVRCIFPFSNLHFAYCRWRRWGWRRWRRMTLLSHRCLWSRWKMNLTNLVPQSERSSPCYTLTESHFFWDVVLDHWSIRRNTRFHRKAFRAITLLACSRGLSLSRIYPILWHTQLPLHAFALLHWRLWLS